MFGRNQRVLLVGGEGVVLYAPTGKGIEREAAISWDVPNFEDQLTETLAAANNRLPVLVLFDGADQTYRKEEGIPKLSPFDRPRFIKRKLELAYPSYPIRAALEIKPPKGAKIAAEAKKLPAYLFVALPETENLDRIGKCLYDAGVPVGGFGLLPAESSSLVKELSAKVFGTSGKKSRWSIVVGQNETGGLRQVVIKDGNLALTRLTPTSEAGVSGPAWVEEATREFRATLTYISRFGYMNEEGLDVMIICGDIERQFFDQKTMGLQNFRCLNPSEALRHLGLRSFGLEKSNFADVVHAAWAARKNKLALAIEVPSIQRVSSPRRTARLATGFLAASALAVGFLGAQAFWSYQSLNSEIEQAQNERDMRTREYEEESKVFDGLPVKPEVLKAAMGVKTLLETNTVNLRPIFHKLKASLGGDIYLEELKLEHKPSPALSGGSADSSGILSATPSEKGTVKIYFKFALPEAMPLEQKVTRAEKLAESLRKDFAGYDVSIASQFGKVERGGKFTGSTVGNEVVMPGALDFAEFEMEGAPL